MGKYSDSPTWADITPLVQPESSPSPLAQINYSDAYVEAMSYLRATMAANEKSERVLELTADVIKMNPAHYTVWLYRAATLLSTKADLQKELTEFLNPISLTFLKNYQIWHHRQTLISALASPAGESAFLATMFARDAKNYHVWSYRQWLVRHFALWDDAAEYAEVERLLAEDVRNNSAWNHRWHLNFARPAGRAALGDALRVGREVRFARAKIEGAPQNESAWNYLRGLLAKAHGEAALDRQEVVEFAGRFAGLGGGEVRSSHALDLLAQLYAEREEEKESAIRALDLLADKYDPIRAPYWRYRKALVNGGVSVAS